MHLSTGPESVEAGLKTLRPAVQYLSGILPVEEGDVAPLTCMHNTVRVRFDLDEAEYVSLARQLLRWHCSAGAPWLLARGDPPASLQKWPGQSNNPSSVGAA